MKTLLCCLTLLVVALYYGVLAYAPGLLAGRLAGWPLSILFALAAFAALFAITLFAALRRDDTP
ncbi:hypothetical protein [Craterilacuibacter sinensis]|uniref:DUF485 domain-containing protein n=1 Tax=Craterilacuibacter sinensis TaxID=2686017 RepID=A0A845BT04_9NEIS|nr:hypothetical protein [Craterilacuibacter sinensis]MXR37701.1 hypothetical protein [Craterilacuibacter sinensis]